MQVELLIVGDEARLIAPKQDGVDFEQAVPKLRELARILSVDLGLPVLIDGDPERHLHAPEGETVSFASRHRAHGH